MMTAEEREFYHYKTAVQPVLLDWEFDLRHMVIDVYYSFVWDRLVPWVLQQKPPIQRS